MEIHQYIEHQGVLAKYSLQYLVLSNQQVFVSMKEDSSGSSNAKTTYNHAEVVVTAT